MEEIFEFVDDFHDDYIESGYKHLKHKYINEEVCVNYMSVNGVEYVIGEYDNRDDALLNLNIISNINKGNKELDWISSREGIYTEGYIEYMSVLEVC